MFTSTLLLRKVNISSLCSDGMETIQQTKQAHDAQNIPPDNLTTMHVQLALIQNNFYPFKSSSNMYINTLDRGKVYYCVGRIC